MTQNFPSPMRHELPELHQPYFWDEKLQLCLLKNFKTKPSEVVVISYLPFYVKDFLFEEFMEKGKLIRSPRVIIRHWTPRWGWEEFHSIFWSSRRFWISTDYAGAGISPFRAKILFDYVMAEYQRHIQRSYQTFQNKFPISEN